MALKRKKLDAICAHLKQTSAVDVHSTTLNGDLTSDDLLRNNNDVKDDTKTAISTTSITVNNNNENEVTDLNEKSEPVSSSVTHDFDPHPSGNNSSASKSEECDNEGDPSLVAHDAQTSPDTIHNDRNETGPDTIHNDRNETGPDTAPSSSCEVSEAIVARPPGWVDAEGVQSPSGVEASIAATAPVAPTPPVLNPLIGAGTGLVPGSSRRKRKAARPRLVCQQRHVLCDEDADSQDGEERAADVRAPGERGLVGNRRDASCEATYSPRSPLAAVARPSRDRVARYLNPETRSLDLATAGQPLDLSTSRSAQGVPAAARAIPNFLFDKRHEDDDDDDSLPGDSPARTNPSTAASSPTPSSSSSTSLVVNAEAKVLLDYANTTMNELLGIFGLGAGAGAGAAEAAAGHNLTALRALAAASSRRKAGAPMGRVTPGWAGLVGAVIPSAGVGVQEGSTSGAEDCMSVSSGDGLDLSPAHPPEAHSKKTSGNVTKYKFHNFQPAPAKGGDVSSTPQKISASDYNKYIKKFRNGTECGGSHCQDLGYREHYHCHDCSFKVFVKKEEMVRHYKWHKKRDESLQQGFLRFSPLDDCSIKYGPCAHNKRQTHYHCIQSGCEKVYVSTSDVQMHANFHRKDSAIIQEGFQRFRATEDCGTTMCAFYGHRTTHFHCRRSNCNFTFKNKADMEKHKSYHQKDEVLGRDGFKKFMKYEHCAFQGCRFSKVSNHIHCIRPACSYVLHSTAQLYSHKRKHERREFESLYRSFRQTQRPLIPAVPVPNSTVTGAPVAKAAIPISALPRNIVSVTAAGAMPVGRQVLTAVPLKGIGEPMVAQTVAGGQLPQLVTKIPIKLSDGVPLMLTPTGAVIWSGAQTAAVQNMASNVSPRPLLSTSQSSGTSSLCTSKDASINTVSSGVNISSCSMVADISDSKREDTVSSSIKKTPDSTGSNKKTPDSTGSNKKTPDSTGSNKKSPDYTSSSSSSKKSPENTGSSSKKAPDNTGSSSTSKKLLQGDVHVKLEPKSEDSDDEEDKTAGAPASLSPAVDSPSPVPVTKTTATSPLPFTNIATKLQAIMKSENLNDSLTLPIPVQEANKNVELKVKNKPLMMKPVKQEVGIGSSMVTSPGQVMSLLPPMKKVGAPEKRERDESWKSYLIRYTANDPCNSRCQLLYKDHYHCKIAGCPVLFRSKDGVREHAKLHNLQDNLTPLVYVRYSEDQHCPSSCQHSQKVSHYHCNWTGCNHVIAEPTPTFARLEHYRIHEYAKAAAGKNYRSHSLQGPNSGSIILNTLADSGSRRRGRPPKYPRLDAPSVPKVELSQQEIRESSQASIDGEGAGAEEKIVNGFRRFDATELCPDDMCLYRSQLHYHCGRPRCHTATNRVDILNLHAKDFHSFVNILPHFEFFDRNVNCRRTFCSNNTINRHYHCTRPRCDYSFVRHSTMAQHSKKHVTEGGATVTPIPAGGLSLPPGTRLQPVQLLRRADGQTYIPIVPAPLPSPNGDKSVVKASGTFFPLSGLSAATVSGVGMVTSAGAPLTSTLTFTLPANMVTAGGIPIMAPIASTTAEAAGLSPMPVNLLSAGMISGSAGPVSATTAAALTVLLQQKSNSGASGVLQPSWSAMRNRMHYSLQANCGRPFCKLKKKDHYHCLECNQAFSDPARLRGHISKHGVKFRKASIAQRMPGGATATLSPPNPTAIRLLAAPQAAEMGLDLSHPREEGDTKKREDDEVEEETGPEDEERVDEDEENASLSSSLSLKIGTFSSSLQDTSTAMDSADMDCEDKSLVMDSEESSQSEDASMENSNDGVDDDEDEAELMTGADQGPHYSFEPSTCAASPTAISRRSSRKRTLSSRHADFVSNDDSAVLAKQMKLKLSGPIPSAAPVIPPARSSPANRSVPDGFIRFHCSNDCGHVRCAYRQTVTHYHCTRPECAYGFSDKSRILQHQSRHERLDSLMGGEFQQFRATVQCGRADCEFSEKASHFHCLKCVFVCADSSKVLAHRKYHAKLDNISNNGFQKFGAMQACGQAMCAYSRKQTHYHCMHEGCKHAVLGPAQMAPHKLKHVT